MASPTDNNVPEHEAAKMDTVIAGYFVEGGVPYVKLRIFLPRLSVVGSVDFLVDTGAVTTVLHPGSARDLACPFDQLVLPIPFEGVGGVQTYYRELALIGFEESNEGQDIAFELSIAKPGSPADGLPSLLGRNILNQLRMEYNFPQGRLEFEPF